MWHESTGSHRQEAALVGYNAGIVHLSSPDGTLLEIQEGKLSPDDFNHVRSLDVYKNWKRKVTSYPFELPAHLLTHPEQEPQPGMGPPLPRFCFI